MNESQFYHGGASNPSQNGSSSSGKRGRGGGRPVEEGVVISSCTSPCGACKFLRRKCINGCIFAPYFGNDQGAAKFAAVHKVFGASNVSKLLMHIPVSRRQDAVVTICYEAQARLSDPVYGCVSTILALEQQVSSLQAELETVQTQLINNRIAFQASQTLSQHQNIAALQPTNSNTSSVSNNHLMNFDPISVPNSTAREEDEEDSHIPIAFTTQIID